MNGLKKRVIYIDCCAFDILFDEEINITKEFPDSEYVLKTTKGVVNELEDIGVNKQPIKDFSLALVNSDKINVDCFFGFSDGLNNYRHIGGFDEGKLASISQNSFLNATKGKLGNKQKKSGIQKHQADRDLLALGLGQIILTAETVLGCTELKQLAENQDTKVINIAEWQDEIQSKYVTLRKYVERNFN